MLAIVFVFAAAGYLLLLLGSSSLALPGERKLGASGAGQPNVHIYLELISVDAVRNAMQVRVNIEPTGLGIDAQSMLPDRDLILVMSHDKRGERIEVHAHQPIPTTAIELDLYDGDITAYPLDSYHASLSIRCLDASAQPSAQAKLLPLDLTVWERVLGFRVQTGLELSSVSGEDRLTFQIHRSRAFTFFAVAGYGAMVVLACLSLTIAVLTFLRVRRPEATLMGALGAIVFALPALRNALPGGPPLGVLADMFVFVWAEWAVVFALVLVVATWARSGPRP